MQHSDGRKILSIGAFEDARAGFQTWNHNDPLRMVARLPLFLSYGRSLPCTQHHFPLKGKPSEGPYSDASRWGWYSLQCSSSILSRNPIASPAVMRFKGAPRRLRCPQCNNRGTAASEFNCSQHLSIWLDLVHRFIGSLFYFFSFFFFVFVQVVSGYCTTGSVLWIASNIPSQSRALHIV